MHELVKVGIERYNDLKRTIVRHEPTKDNAADEYYNDLAKYPHIYVLACLMDKQIKAEKAWHIPFEVCNYFNTFEMSGLAKLSKEQIEEYFLTNKPHRFNKDMSEVFYEAIQRIHNLYNDDASKIWSDKPSSAAVVYRFLQFKGAGIKIATMATNILVREYHIELSDYYSIDISPDVQVKRIFYRMGLVENEEDVSSIVYKARELYPEFPGIIDVACWEIGRTYCNPTTPNCNECPLNHCCKKTL